MVQEYRKIILSTDELVSALELYRRIAPDFLPAGKITRCAVLEYGVIKLTLEAGEGEKTRQSYVTFRGPDVLKPAIGFCIEHKIILPKEGRKSIEVQRGSVVLRVELSVLTRIVDKHAAKETSTAPPVLASAPA